MKRKEKNDLLKRMAEALDNALSTAVEVLPKEQASTIVGILRECDEQMPHFVAKDAPRRYNKLIAEKQLDLTVEVEK